MFLLSEFNIENFLKIKGEYEHPCNLGRINKFKGENALNDGHKHKAYLQVCGEKVS